MNIRYIIIDLEPYANHYLKKHFEVSDATICRWKRTNRIPGKHIEKLSKLITQRFLVE